ncbi:hypothetical protein WS82_08145 [Burkholderia sp. MSMB2041]|uniref:Uncharacterized protein n=1 Tax=Burkholderia savannae TaxID=1637837 RepID=A0ABR5TBQ8_9BURK|nr:MULTISPECIES: hypothetical protein [Burkholderia]AOJ73396.1 hypothetical protein WS78_31465 [Burkholderia savannae]KVG93919.1 hypothetical protein WS82_08145 [Burkholderia sp. MSMB2041]KVK76155.1 hypothetical protein WS91_16665 [Burkholderia sp. MSMB1498]KWZ39888.1 hypothetical protein WS72_18655 [Burkholderia savannae]
MHDVRARDGEPGFAFDIDDRVAPEFFSTRMVERQLSLCLRRVASREIDAAGVRQRAGRIGRADDGRSSPCEEARRVAAYCAVSMDRDAGAGELEPAVRRSAFRHMRDVPAGGADPGRWDIDSTP